MQRVLRAYGFEQDGITAPTPRKRRRSMHDVPAEGPPGRTREGHCLIELKDVGSPVAATKRDCAVCRLVCRTARLAYTAGAAVSRAQARQRAVFQARAAGQAVPDSRERDKTRPKVCTSAVTTSLALRPSHAGDIFL